MTQAAPRAAPPPIAGNVSWRFAATLARFALAFVTVPLLTRSLGMSQWGLLALFQAAITPLVILDAGMSAATVKLVAEAIGRGDRAEAAALAKGVALFNAIAGAAGAIAMGLAASWLSSAVFLVPPDQVALSVAGFRLVGVNWFIVFASGTYAAVVAAHQRYDRIALVAFSIAAVSTLLSLAVALGGGDVVAVLCAQTATSVAGAGAWYLSAGALLSGMRGWPRWSGPALRKALRFGSWSAASSIGTIVSGWSDRYVLGVVLGPTVVGFYAIAHMLHSQVYGAFCEMNDVLFPALSHRHGQGDLAGARRLALLAGWATTLGYGTAATVVAVLGGDFLSLWISPEAALRVTGILRLLSVGGVIGIATLAPLQYMMGTGNARAHASAVGATALVIAGASAALVPRMGLGGVGIGLILGVLVRGVVVGRMWLAGPRKMEAVREFALHLWVAPLVAIVSICAFSALHDRLGFVPSWPGLFVELALVGACAAGLQLAVARLLPGGRDRRAAVLSSFRPVLDRFAGRGRKR